MLLLVALFWAVLGSAWAEAAPAPAEPDRMLTAITVDGTDTVVRVRLALDGNNGRPLGKVYFGGQKVRVVVEKTALKDKKAIVVQSKDSLLKQVEARASGRNVEIQLILNQKVDSILENILFQPGPAATVVELRKPAFYQKNQAAPPVLPPLLAEKPKEVPTAKPEAAPVAAPTPAAQPTAPADDHLAQNLIPLVTPEGLEGNEAPTPAPKRVDPAFQEKREKALAKVLKSSGDEGRAPRDEEGKTPLQVGVAAPDLTNLYLMAAVILIVALVWFAVRRNRRFLHAGFDEPLRVIKAQSIGPRQKLLIVEADGRRFLISTSEKEVHFLSELGYAQTPDEQMADAMSGNVSRLRAGSKPDLLRSLPTISTVPPLNQTSGRRGGRRPSFFGSQNAIEDREYENGSEAEETLREQLRSLRKEK